MTALVVIGCILSYFLVGAVFARSMAASTWKKAKAKIAAESWYTKSIIESRVRGNFAGWMTVYFFAWPFVGPVAALLAFINAPVNDRLERAKKLRADAAMWRDKQRTGTAAERQMAAELARLCEEQAREVDL